MQTFQLPLVLTAFVVWAFAITKHFQPYRALEFQLSCNGFLIPTTLEKLCYGFV